MIDTGMIDIGIRRRTFLAGAAALTLSACGSDLLGPPDAGPIYPVRPTFAPPPAGPKVGWALSILRPDVPGGLDSDRIALLQANGTLDYFAKATYPDRLPATIQRALVEGFQASGRIDAVAREQDALHADYNLFVAVKDFQANYSVQDGIPQAVTVMTAQLTTARGRKIIGTFTTSKSLAASVNSTGAATQALSQVLGQAVTEIVNWTLTAAPAIVPGQSPETSTARPAEQLLRDVTRGSEQIRDTAKP
jgi:cholesterol transport system auxiliary component